MFLTLRFGQIILIGSALGFLGMGAQPPTAELGMMAAQGRDFLFMAPHIADHPEPGDLRHRARRQSAGRRVARRSRSQAAAVRMAEPWPKQSRTEQKGGQDVKAISHRSAALWVPGFGSVGQAQTLNMMKSHRCAALRWRSARPGRPTSDIVNMMQDTLVALDWDGRTPIPYLAKSWTVSPDGKTLHLQAARRRAPFAAARSSPPTDVIYSFKRLKDPATKAPYAWRAGNIKELRAPDPYTVEYELEEPYSELLLQLTMYTNAIHNKDSVESLGKDYGIKGIDGTGPWCFVSWQPRTEIVLKRHDAYRWGPSMYQNKGPVKFEKLVIKIVPEDFEPRRRR